MTAKIFHVSDLHIGRHEAFEPWAALHDLVAAAAPEIVVATGDLTHRGKRSQLERAAELLGGLGPPVLAVPGNHDIPYTFPARFTRPFEEWNRVFGTTEPVHASKDLFIAGVNSVRPSRHQAGAVEPSALRRLTSTLDSAPTGTMRVVALHHHLAAPPWRAAGKRPLRARDGVLRSLATAGVELVLGGHVHQTAVAERREFEVLDRDANRALVLVTVAGFGRPRPQRRGEAVGFNAYEVERDAITVISYSWSGRTFGQAARRVFSRL